MGLAGLSFAAGLGTGYMNQSQYQDRQDQIAREQALRDAEFQMRKSAMDEALAERAQERANRQAVASAAKDAEVKTSTTLDTGDGPKVYDMPKGVDSQDVAAPDSRQFRRNTEETTGVEVPIPAVSSATTVNGKAYDSAAAGLKAAAEYNDPAAKSLRIAAALEAAGRPDAAMDYRMKAEKFRSDLYEAQRNALFNKGSELIAGKRYEGLADTYNRHYKDGRSALFVPSGAGGVFVISDEKTNAEVGRIPVTGDANADIMTWQQMVYPDKAAAAAAEEKRKSAEEARKTITAAPGAKIFTRDGRLVAENTNRTSADARVETAGLGGGHGSRGSASGNSSPPGETTDAAVNDALKAAFSGSDMKMSSPEMSASVGTWAHAINRNNAGRVPAHLAVQAAIMLANKPDAEQPVINPKTGTVDMAVKTNQGEVITRRDYADGLSKEKMRELVTGLQKKMPTQEFETLRDIAFDKSGKSFRRYLDGKAAQYEKEIKSNPAWANAPADKVSEAIARQLKLEEPVYRKLASLLSENATDLGAGLEFNNGVRAAPPVKARTQQSEVRRDGVQQAYDKWMAAKEAADPGFFHIAGPSQRSLELAAKQAEKEYEEILRSSQSAARR